MVVAVVVAVAVMMAASGPLAAFINRNPTVFMLALSFLLMIGMTLIADGFGFHIERGYIYAAMFFSSLVEALNALARRKVKAADVTLTSLIIFAAVYFAAVATPGPGVAALVARVLGHGLDGVAPFIAGYVVGDMVWLMLAGDGLAVLARDLRWPVRRDQVRRRRLSALCRVEDGDCAGRARRSGARRLARLAGVSRLAVADPRQSQGDDLLPLDHAARRRRQDADPLALGELAALCGRRHLLDARGLCARRQPRAGAPAFDPRHALRPSRRGRS